MKWIRFGHLYRSADEKYAIEKVRTGGPPVVDGWGLFTADDRPLGVYRTLREAKAFVDIRTSPALLVIRAMMRASKPSKPDLSFEKRPTPCE